MVETRVEGKSRIAIHKIKWNIQNRRRWINRLDQIYLLDLWSRKYLLHPILKSKNPSFALTILHKITKIILNDPIKHTELHRTLKKKRKKDICKYKKERAANITQPIDSFAINWNDLWKNIKKIQQNNHKLANKHREREREKKKIERNISHIGETAFEGNRTELVVKCNTLKNMPSHSNTQTEYNDKNNLCQLCRLKSI